MIGPYIRDPYGIVHICIPMIDLFGYQDNEAQMFRHEVWVVDLLRWLGGCRRGSNPCRVIGGLKLSDFNIFPFSASNASELDGPVSQWGRIEGEGGAMMVHEMPIILAPHYHGMLRRQSCAISCFHQCGRQSFFTTIPFSSPHPSLSHAFV